MFIVKKPLLDVIKTKLKLFVGRCVLLLMRQYDFYKSVNGVNAKTHAIRLSDEFINQLNEYVETVGYVYKNSLDIYRSNGEIKKTAQYFPYQYIDKSRGSCGAICNIGAFYCAADYESLHYLKQATIYALDFGDMEKLNSDLKHERLKVYSGYPLDSLTEIPNKFDYVIFNRTATLININELISYMEVLKNKANKIIFFEVCKTDAITKCKLDLDTIPLYSPQPIFGNMRIHNYDSLLKKFGYKVIHKEILPPELFSL